MPKYRIDIVTTVEVETGDEGQAIDAALHLVEGSAGRWAWGMDAFAQVCGEVMVSQVECVDDILCLPEGWWIIDGVRVQAALRNLPGYERLRFDGPQDRIAEVYHNAHVAAGVDRWGLCLKAMRGREWFEEQFQGADFSLEDAIQTAYFYVQEGHASLKTRPASYAPLDTSDIMKFMQAQQQSVL